jgi:hypothetical protein
MQGQITVTDRKEDDVALLKQELTELSEACARLKNHPALGQAQNLVSLGIEHAELMMNYANQLDHLFKTITRHAETLRRLAERDVDAQALSVTVERTIADLDRTISPVINSLRRHAWSLGAGRGEATWHGEAGGDRRWLETDGTVDGAAGDDKNEDKDDGGQSSCSFDLMPGRKLPDRKLH